jgi:hypothetical protein
MMLGIHMECGGTPKSRRCDRVWNDHWLCSCTIKTLLVAPDSCSWQKVSLVSHCSSMRRSMVFLVLGRRNGALVVKIYITMKSSCVVKCIKSIINRELGYRNVRCIFVSSSV